MNITLTRFSYTDQHTLGRLIGDSLRLATMERPWLPNSAGPGGRRMTSCVPDGAYIVRPHSGDRFTDVYALVNPALGVYELPQDVPAGQLWGRSAILIHPGNRVDDIVGCIAVGINHGFIMSEPAVLASQIAMGKLREALGSSTHQLQVRPTAGTEEIAA